MMSVGGIRFHSIMLQFLVNCYVKNLKYQLQMEFLFIFECPLLFVR